MLAAGWSAAATGWGAVTRAGSAALSVASALPTSAVRTVTDAARACARHRHGAPLLRRSCRAEGRRVARWAPSSGLGRGARRGVPAGLRGQHVRAPPTGSRDRRVHAPARARGGAAVVPDASTRCAAARPGRRRASRRGTRRCRRASAPRCARPRARGRSLVVCDASSCTEDSRRPCATRAWRSLMPWPSRHPLFFHASRRPRWRSCWPFTRRARRSSWASTRRCAPGGGGRRGRGAGSRCVGLLRLRGGPRDAAPRADRGGTAPEAAEVAGWGVPTRTPRATARASWDDEGDGESYVHVLELLERGDAVDVPRTPRRRPLSDARGGDERGDVGQAAIAAVALVPLHVVAVQHHHLRPDLDEVADEPLLPVGARVGVGDRAELRVRAEHEIVARRPPARLAGRLTRPVKVDAVSSSLVQTKSVSVRLTKEVRRQDADAIGEHPPSDPSQLAPRTRRPPSGRPTRAR